MKKSQINFPEHSEINKKSIFVFSNMRHFSHLAQSCGEKSPEEFKIFGNRAFEFKNFLFHFVQESDANRGMLRSSGRDGNFYMFYPTDPGYYFSEKKVEEIERINNGRLKLIKTIKDFNFLLKNGNLPGDRNIGEILESLKEGEIPNHEECYWALLAFAKRLAHIESSPLRTDKIIKTADPNIQQVLEDLSCVSNDSTLFLESNPKNWLGKDVPLENGVKSFREMSKTIVERALIDQHGE